MIATDALARFQRLDGKDVFFLTGTDEHGLKMLQTAARKASPPSELADRNSASIPNMVEAADVSNDDFIRTTEEAPLQGLPGDLEGDGRQWRHLPGPLQPAGIRCARSLFRRKGDDRRRRRRAREPLGSPVEWVEEETYFFRLSAYQDRLLELYESQPDFIGPAERRNEVISFVKSGLKDLSISRSTFDWGVPVPGDEST